MSFNLMVFFLLRWAHDQYYALNRSCHFPFGNKIHNRLKKHLTACLTKKKFKTPRTHNFTEWLLCMWWTWNWNLTHPIQEITSKWHSVHNWNGSLWMNAEVKRNNDMIFHDRTVKYHSDSFTYTRNHHFVSFHPNCSDSIMTRLKCKKTWSHLLKRIHQLTKKLPLFIDAIGLILRWRV